MKLYIAGKITGDPDYKRKFKKVEELLIKEGYAVMNPAVLPTGFEYQEYMQICFSMIDVCDGVYLLYDFCDSKGAITECRYAAIRGKFIKLGLGRKE